MEQHNSYKVFPILKKIAASTALIGSFLLNSANAIAKDERGFFNFPPSYAMLFKPSAAGSIITSIQAVSIDLADPALSNTATISSVDTARSIVLFGGGYTTQITDGTHARVRLSLTDATTVTATRDTTTAGTYTVKGTVIQFATGVATSIQQGTILIDNATSNTATISSVTTTRTAVFFQGDSCTGVTATEANFLCNLELTNATTVTAARSGNSSTADSTVGYVVVEFAASYIQSVQHVTVTVSAATSGTATISSVTTANCWTAWGGYLSSSADSACWGRVSLTNATTVTANHDDTASATHKCVIIEFVAGVVDSVQRGVITVDNASTTNTATISAVTTAKTVANYTGFSSNGDEPDEAFLSIVLTDATTITAQKGATSGISTDDGNVNYEAIEFV